MAYVEMFRIPETEDGDFDNLDCSSEGWDALRELGERCGWEPMGTFQGTGPKAEEENRWRAEVEASMRPDWKAFLKQPRPADPALQNAHFEERGKYLRYDLYSPREYGDDREVVAEDARAWAAALERALASAAIPVTDKNRRGVVITEGAPLEVNHLAVDGISQRFIEAFVAYLKRGRFGFAWSS